MRKSLTITSALAGTLFCAVGAMDIDRRAVDVAVDRDLLQQ